jgi:RNA polymerase sigma-70 factor, ECF subfamily
MRHPSTSPQSSDPADDSARDIARAELALADRVRGGDEAALATLYRRYYGGLCAFARGLVGHTTDAEEVVHEVFLRVWERRAEWRVIGTVRAYLFGATRNTALNLLRGQHVEWRWGAAFEREPHPVGMAARRRTGDELSAAREIDEAVAQAIERLPEQCRLVYTMRWHHDLSYAEIAQALGIAPKTVERHVHLALVTLRRRLAKYR